VNIEELDKLASHLMPSAARLMREAATELRRLRALESEAIAAGFIGEDGEVRKVLGTLPLTADGCIVGNHITLWINDVGEVASLRVDNIGCSERDGLDGAFWEAGECYSTPEAARDAKEARDANG
jgi:hypothetical protein